MPGVKKTKKATKPKATKTSQSDQETSKNELPSVDEALKAAAIAKGTNPGENGVDPGEAEKGRKERQEYFQIMKEIEAEKLIIEETRRRINELNEGDDDEEQDKAAAMLVKLQRDVRILDSIVTKVTQSQSPVIFSKIRGTLDKFLVGAFELSDDD